MYSSLVKATESICHEDTYAQFLTECTERSLSEKDTKKTSFVKKIVCFYRERSIGESPPRYVDFAPENVPWQLVNNLMASALVISIQCHVTHDTQCC